MIVPRFPTAHPFPPEKETEFKFWVVAKRFGGTAVQAPPE
jgi:hypothetical protein